MHEEIINPKPHVQLTDSLYEDILQALTAQPERLPALLEPLHPADVADILERLPQRKREVLLSYIPKEQVGDTLIELEEGVKDHLLHVLEPEEVAEAVAELDSDDIADIVQTLEEDHSADFTTAEQVKEGIETQNKRLLKYEPHSAGGLMQVEVLTAKPEQKISQVLRYLRNHKEELGDNPGTVFVLNDKRKLLGTISLPRLVQCPLNETLQNVMRKKPITLLATTPEEEVASVFEKYNMHNCAVVNKRGQLLGRITIDDVLDSVLEHHERETKRAAGLSEREDIFAPISATTRQRLPWLIINLFTAILASCVIAIFQNQIEKLVALAVLMPIVASMGGNAATQTMTVVVRGLATGQITAKNAVTLLVKELTVGSLNGILLAFLVALGTYFFYQDIWLGSVIFIATVANHIFAATAGHAIPLLLKKCKYDPAISSGVLVTTVTDVGGFFVFLGLAALLLL
ncbi:MAG: magnesium transporter [Alphaproteobacteria bacterium]|nr:magnesium transporter [Alphaproteobacteria bacterium]MDD9920369.1 magnesium transporter [Alphaproteobacteria bacterium]